MSKVACVVISLLLGIIIGLAAVVGGVFLVLSLDVDTILGWVGLEDNNKNEDGTYVYIAGDQSLLKTINDTIDFFSNLDSSSLAGLNDFLPAVGLAVDNVADYLFESTGVELDVDGLMNCPINDLGGWLSDWVREIQLYPVVETLLPSYIEGDDVMAVIVKALVLGVEADYYTDEDGERYPVYYYTEAPDRPSPYGVKFLADEEGDDEEGAEDNYVYYYYYVDADGVARYLEKLEDGTYRPVGKEYEGYSEDTATCTGDYYRVETEDGYEYVIVDPVVLGDFYDSENLSESIYAISLDDLLGEGDLADLLGDYTIGDLVNDGIDFNEFEVADFIDLNPENDDLFISIIYGISQLEKNEDGTWSGIYNDDDGPHEVTIELDESGCIDRAYYTVEDKDGSEKVVEIAGVTLGGISESLSTLELVTVMGYPDVTDALMMYILYGVTDVYKERGDDGEYVYYATYTKGDVEYKAEITVTTEDDGTIRATSSSYRDPENQDMRISTATNLDNISNVTDNILDALSIADFVGDVDAGDALFMYLSYGVYDIYQDENGNWYGYKKITTTTGEGEEAKKVTSEVLVQIIIKEKDESTEDGKDYVDYIIYTTDGTRVKGTKIDELDDVIDGIMSDLTLDVFISDVKTDDALMAYLLYSVTGIDSRTNIDEDKGEEYTEWFATFHTGEKDENGEEITFEVILETYTGEDSDENQVVYVTGILGVKISEEDADYEKYQKYIEEHGRIRGATIDDINGQIDGLMDNVPIKDIINLGDEDNIILNAIGDATISTLGDAINNITVQSLFTDDIYKNTVTLFLEYDSETQSFTYVYEDTLGISHEESGEDYYLEYTFYYRLQGDGAYVYHELTYPGDDEGTATKIKNREDLEVAFCAYNCSAEEGNTITEVFIYTTTWRKAVSESDYADDEYFKATYEGYVENKEEGASGKYEVNDAILFNPLYIYYYEDGSLAGDNGKLTADEFAELQVDVYTYGEVVNVWTFMLCKKTEIENGYGYNEEVCGINDMDKLMSRTTDNLASATLYDFYDIGILTSAQSTLDVSVDSYYSGKNLGDLTLDEVISLMGQLLTPTSP